MRRIAGPWKTTVSRWTLLVLLAAGFAACGRIASNVGRASTPPGWKLHSSTRLTPEELWKEHNGGDRLYMELGCVSETMSDYRHRARPWVIRSSVFDQSTAEGAQGLFVYYRDCIDNEEPEVEPIGDKTYLWTSPGTRCWIVGFCRGKYFAEVSLADESQPETPLTTETRDALLAFCRHLAASL